MIMLVYGLTKINKDLFQVWQIKLIEKSSEIIKKFFWL